MKYTKYLSIAALSVLMISCAKEQSVSEDGQELTITASFVDNQTKTTLQDGGTQVLWETGDEIKVFYEGTGGRFTSTLTASAATSDFSGSLNFVFGVNEGVGGSKSLWAVYPYRSDATSDGSSVTTTLPTEQVGKAGSFAKGMNLSLAKSSSFTMGFYNVCGGVRFSVVKEGVIDIVFEGLNGEDVAGKVKLAFADGVPVVSEVVEGEKTITLTAPGGGAFETGKWYYIVALPGTLSSGFKMTYNTATQYAVLKSSSSVTIKRSKFGSLADADDGLIYKDKGTPEPSEDNIVFKDNAAKFACVAKYDTDGDGEVSVAEAEAATSFDGLFTNWKSVASFDEIKYFKNVHSLSGVFKGCDKLVSITIPENINDLGSSAFYGCSSLTSVVLPSGITAIGSDTFQHCSKLASIDIPSNVKTIGSCAFNCCSSLVSADLPSKVTSIGVCAFNTCSALKTVTLPSKLATINDYAFDGCTALEQIVIPDGVTSLGSRVFQNCTALKSANIPSGISYVPDYCFYGCSSLTSVTVPSGVTSVGQSAFYGVKMWKLELPSTVTRLGSQSMGSISCVIVPTPSPVSIESNTFSGVFAVFVPTKLMEMYKAMTHWSSYSSRLHPLTSYREKSEFVLGTSGAVDMGTSVKWAAYNVGATKPEEYGRYFAWGDVVGQTWNGASWSGGGFSTYPSYELDANNNLKLEYDAAHVILGGAWRMPTKAEYQELIDVRLWEWTTYEGAKGIMVYSINTGNKIFLPAAGDGNDGYQRLAGSGGYYWSSTFYGNHYAWGLSFYSGNVYTDRYYHYLGQSVRPVSE